MDIIIISVTTAKGMEGGQELEDAGKIQAMKELKEQSLKYGFFIHTVKGRGYRLEIIEEEKFRDALAVEEDVEVTKVLFKLFFERTCKLDDLAELLHYSRSGMSRIIEKVEKKLEREGLRLLNKPYVGFFIGGSEVYIRNYLYKLLKKKSLEETEKIFRVPREMLATACTPRVFAPRLTEFM